jgi:hypothetical protein
MERAMNEGMEVAEQWPQLQPYCRIHSDSFVRCRFDPQDILYKEARRRFMGFLDSLSKTLSTGVDRAKFEADKFQRTSRVNGEINNIKSQIDTNIRQLGERALELYQQGAITAPEIASLAQIIAQLRDQQNQKEDELNTTNAETFEVWQASQPQSGSTSAQNVPISSDPGSSYTPPVSSSSSGSYTTPSSGLPSSSGYDQSTSSSPTFTGRTYDFPESTDMSGTGLPNSGSVGGDASASGLPVACPNCGYSVPSAAAFCPNCGSRVTHI